MNSYDCWRVDEDLGLVCAGLVVKVWSVSCEKLFITKWGDDGRDGNGRFVSGVGGWVFG